jgi:hypothetical protein
MHPLVEEAMRKTPITWLTVAGRPPYPVWCLWIDGALYIVSGPGEQPAPGLVGTSVAIVTARGDHGGRIVAWRATVAVMRNSSAEWTDLATQLAGKRLNSAGTEELVDRWRRDCVISRLTPDEPLEAGPSLPDGSLAAAPVPSPATAPMNRPFRLHRVRRPDRS